MKNGKSRRQTAIFGGTAIAAVGLLTAGVTACSSSSSSAPSSPSSSASSPSSSASTGATASAAAATGTPIKIMAFGQFQASTFSYPEGQTAIEAAAKSLNAAGGIDGH